jgi:GT2 family glycosyltransferase
VTANDITVVIPTLGRELLHGCLASLAGGEMRPSQVIVVDQGRVPALARMADEFGANGLDVVYVPSTRTGRSAGLNTGIALVRTMHLAITDDDCIAAPDWIGRIAAALRSEPRAIVTGRVEAGAGDVQLSVSTSRVPAVQRRPHLRFDRLSGGNMAMAAAVARAVGPFDEDACLRTAEDAEFAYRALRAGIAIIYAPDVVVSHLGWRDAPEREAQYRSYGYSLGGFYGKYLRRGDGFMALRIGIHLLRSSRRWLTGVMLGDRERARNGRAYVAGLLPGVIAGWRSLGRAA